MKKISFACLVVIVSAVGTVQAQPYHYEVSPAGTIDFTTHEYLAPGYSIDLDIYLTGVGAPQNSGGVWIDFSASTADLSYVSAGIAYPPWDPPGPSITFFPPGIVMIVVGSLSGAPPDGSGNLMIGYVRLQNLGPGANPASVHFTTIPSFGTWSPIVDSDITPGAIVIEEVCACTTDSDCDDGLFCNGVEVCNPICECNPGADPCDDGDRCTLDCDEGTNSCLSDVCDVSALSCYTDPCVQFWPCLESGCIQHCDADCDLLNDASDNCPNTPNALIMGTCTRGNIGIPCDPWSGDAQCDTEMGAGDGFCSSDQEDTYPPQGNGIGDACDCESDFNCDGNVDASDVTLFLGDFGRSPFNNPCSNGNPCNGDFSCNWNVDALDVNKFLEDFGRSQFNNPCPPCVVGDWCVY